MTLPADYGIRIVNDRDKGFTIILKFKGSEIGSVEVVKTIMPCNKRPVQVFETHSRLDDEHWHKGLGVEMYGAAIEHALKKGFSIVSSNRSSRYAQRVWNSTRLAKKFHIMKLKNRWWATRVRQQPIE